MTWGDLQSVIQLAAALNSIYLGLFDIRNPFVTAEQRALERFAAAVRLKRREIGDDPDAKLAMSGILTSATDLNTNFSQRMSAFDAKDGPVAGFCIVAVFAYITLLIISSFKYQDPIGAGCALVIAVAGYLPITAGLILNLRLVSDLKSTVRRDRRAAETRLASIKIPPKGV